MELIKCIEIEGFRSLTKAKIEPIGGFTCFVGANNCGKSNILRALNLFFNDEPEPGVDVDLVVDCYADPKSKKKKQVIVSVSFALPPIFRFRQGLEELEQAVGRDFTIRRIWGYYPPEPVTEVAKDGHDFKRLDPYLFDQLTNLINFRYIQNRTIPTQVLREEGPTFQAAIARRLPRKGIQAEDVLTVIRSTAADFVSEADKRVRESIDSIRKLEMLAPQDIAALAVFTGFSAEISTGAVIPDSALGAGSQAFTMFNLLKIVDTDYGRHFGWRQAAIWAVEEPESSLHRDLQQILAVTLRDWVDEASSRMQLFTTTHSEIFATAANEGFLVTLADGRTTVHHEAIPNLVYRTATMGITGSVEPILCFPMDPVVLVEGPLDRWILTYVSRQTGIAANCKFVSLEELDPGTAGGGVDKIIKYLQRNGKLIPNRATNAPLLVLFDWDVDDHKLSKAREYYGPNADLRVLRMNTSHADPKISPQIHGIERFYPRALFLAARDAEIVDVLVGRAGNISIEKAKLDPAKHALAGMLCSAPDNSWYQHIQGVLEDVASASFLLPGDRIPFSM